MLNGFLPTTGTFTHVVWPAAVGELATMRIDSWVMAGTEVSPYYDNLCCKATMPPAPCKLRRPENRRKSGLAMLSPHVRQLFRLCWKQTLALRQTLLQGSPELTETPGDPSVPE